MQNRSISNDDVLDVVEMTNVLKSHINSVLQDNEMPIAMSALINATVHVMLDQSENSEELEHYSDCLRKILDDAIHFYNTKKDKF